jgi:[acyl-carrier-protein] S-malonyltransferase
MPDIAFLFPGQGSQSVGMVSGLAAYPEALEIFDRASRILDFDLFDLCLRGPEEKLSQDLFAQLAVHVTNCSYAAILAKMDITPHLGSGFSLGIFSALVAARSLSFEQGLEGVRIAARKMSAEGENLPGAMVAIVGLAAEEVQAICHEVPQAFLASTNTARQVVIAGEEEAVEKALNLCVRQGALLAKRLPVTWPIHTPLMERVSRAFAARVENWEIFPPRFPILSYLRADFLKTPGEIREELSAQFCRQNRWHRVLLRMLEEGIDSFIEVGPGNVLIRMAQWVDRQAKVFAAEEMIRKGKSFSV